MLLSTAIFTGVSQHIFCACVCLLSLSLTLWSPFVSSTEQLLSAFYVLMRMLRVLLRAGGIGGGAVCSRSDMGSNIR